MEFSKSTELIMKLLFYFSSILAANGAILIRQQQPEYPSCDEGIIRNLFYFSPEIRPLRLYCPEKDTLLLNDKCEYSYQCPLDDAFHQRNGTTTCIGHDAWNYQQPLCQDNIDMLDQIEKVLEEQRVQRTMRAQMQGLRPVVLKSIFIASDPPTKKDFVSESKDEEKDIKDEEEEEKDIKDEEEDDEIVEETTPAPVNVTEKAVATPTTPITHKSPRTTKQQERQYQAMLFKIKLTKMCKERKMCMWANMPGRCRIFGESKKESVRILHKLCTACVREVCSKGRGGVALLGGASG